MGVSTLLSALGWVGVGGGGVLLGCKSLEAVGLHVRGGH